MIDTKDQQAPPTTARHPQAAEPQSPLSEKLSPQEMRARAAAIDANPRLTRQIVRNMEDRRAFDIAAKESAELFEASLAVECPDSEMAKSQYLSNLRRADLASAGTDLWNWHYLHEAPRQKRWQESPRGDAQIAHNAWVAYWGSQLAERLLARGLGSKLWENVILWLYELGKPGKPEKGKRAKKIKLATRDRNKGKSRYDQFGAMRSLNATDLGLIINEGREMYGLKKIEGKSGRQKGGVKMLTPAEIAAMLF